jgi:hypothetical protein
MDVNHRRINGVPIEVQCIEEGMVGVNGTPLTDSNEVVPLVDMKLEHCGFGPHQSTRGVPNTKYTKDPLLSFDSADVSSVRCINETVTDVGKIRTGAV